MTTMTMINDHEHDMMLIIISVIFIHHFTPVPPVCLFCRLARSGRVHWKSFWQRRRRLSGKSFPFHQLSRKFLSVITSPMVLTHTWLKRSNLSSSDSWADIPPCVGHKSKLQSVQGSSSTGGGGRGRERGERGERWEKACGHSSDGSSQENLG